MYHAEDSSAGVAEELQAECRRWHLALELYWIAGVGLPSRDAAIKKHIGRGQPPPGSSRSR